jgi:AcrR family transcriptional regulator
MNKSSAQTRDRILEAGAKALQTEGFSGSTSRAIGRIGAFNQALIFYHFGSLEALLLAVLAKASDERLARYREALAPVTSIDELVRVGAQLYEEDKTSGHMTIVSQMIAGSVGKPDLAPKVLAQMEPWVAFAEETLTRLLPPPLPVKELAYAAVTFYTGVNLLTHLDADGTRTHAMFSRAVELAPFLGAVLGGSTPG